MDKGRNTVPRKTSLFAYLVLLASLVCTGCENSQPRDANSEPDAVSENPARTTQATAQHKSTSGDPLARLLQLTKGGDTDAAIRLFVSDSPENWVASTEIEALQISEADFSELPRAERSRLQRQFIDLVGDIKGLARMVIEKASEAKDAGDMEKAEEYVAAVNRLGRQLREANVVTVFQQTGNALANARIDQ
jgi:hypothetical protein